MQHIGIYSGTFDPVHVGHIAFATEAQRAAKLDRVVFMPETQPRGKTGVMDIQERVNLLHAQLAGTNHTIYQARHPRFTIAETLPELLQEYPDARLSFLMGSDIVLSLHKWPDIEQLLAEAQLIVGMRGSDNLEAITSLLSDLGARHLIVTTPHAHISSRQIRQSVHS